MSKYKNKHNNILLKSLGAVVAVVVIVVFLEATNLTHFFHSSPKVSPPTAPLTQLSGNSSSNTGSKVNTPSGSATNNGTSVDQNGKVPSNTSDNSSLWATSSSGLVTLKSPLSNATLHNGDSIFGSASVGPVQFTLIDSQVGVIDQGTISVVSGNFTATLSFTRYSSSGRLDVFNTDSNGREINEVQVPINF